MTLKEIEKRNRFKFSDDMAYCGQLEKDIQWLISRVKKLEEGIRKHKTDIWGEDGIVDHYSDRMLYELLKTSTR